MHKLKNIISSIAATSILLCASDATVNSVVSANTPVEEPIIETPVVATQKIMPIRRFPVIEKETKPVTKTEPEKPTVEIQILGSNIIYIGESFDYNYSFADGKTYENHNISWNVSDIGTVDENGIVTANETGNAVLAITDDTFGATASTTIHFVKYGDEIDFVPEINGIQIANKSYYLPKDYDPGLNKDVVAAFEKLQADAAAAGLNFFIISDYRSYEKQETTYQNWSYLYGQAEADRCSARPGHSEHQLGLSLDVNSCYYDFIGTPEAIWLAENCYKYGFIVRYPSHESEAITGYLYEPWHIRYLGTETATKLYNSGLTLEEYLGIDSYYRT